MHVSPHTRIVSLIPLLCIQELLDLKSDLLKIMNEKAQSKTNGDISCHSQVPVSPQLNGNALPDDDSALPNSLPNGSDVTLSVSHLSAQWMDVSTWYESRNVW